MILKSVLTALLMWVGTAGLAHADGPATQPATQATGDPQDLSGELTVLAKKYKIPGIAVIVVKGDGIAASGVSGVRKQGTDALLTIHDQFHIGSCTKAMTATLCGVLVEEGKLQWDSTIEQVFPELVGKINEASKTVTLEQLLTHRSGLPEDRKPTEILNRMRKFAGTLTEARYAWTKEALAVPSAAAPGTKHQYANAGYMIAGAMCERATGFAWEDLMREKIFKPLGMETAGFGPPGKFGKLDQPLGHTVGNMPIEPSIVADNPAAMGPAGTVHCSLPDWAKFVQAQMMRNQLLKPETFEKLQTPAPDPQIPYAMGWLAIDRDWADGMALHHSGSNGMWFASVWAAPRKEFAVLICTNSGSPLAMKACDDLAEQMIDRFCAQR